MFFSKISTDGWLPCCRGASDNFYAATCLNEQMMLGYWQIVTYPTGGANGFPGTETTLASNTNAPETNAPANNLPHEVAPVFIVILAEDNILPCHSE
jgi:hypothetical protein